MKRHESCNVEESESGFADAEDAVVPPHPLGLIPVGSTLIENYSFLKPLFKPYAPISWVVVLNPFGLSDV